MALINENFLKLPESYLFSDIKKKVEAFKHLHPDANIISLGIGDVTRPIAPVVIEALHAAVDEMGDSKTFRGYGPEQGYDFLQKKIIENDYIHRGVDLAPDEIFISDGAKSDIGNIGDILSMQISRNRSRLSGIYRYQRDGRSSRKYREGRTALG